MEVLVKTQTHKIVVSEKPTKVLKPSHFKRKRGDQICQKSKVLRRNDSKSGP